ncbi:MAG: hypothetical protein NTW21_41130 [Verrucomicrobia bacterium]|nr:hypothetical protein [Verrucomicrobiota bacterium]
MPIPCQFKVQPGKCAVHGTRASLLARECSVARGGDRQVEFFLRLWGLWEGNIDLPPPPKPPFDIDTFEPIIPPERAIKEWVPEDEPPDLRDQSAGSLHDWNQSPQPDPKLRELDLGDGRTLVPCFD